MNILEPFNSFRRERSEDHAQNLYQLVVTSEKTPDGESAVVHHLSRRECLVIHHAEMSETECSSHHYVSHFRDR